MGKSVFVKISLVVLVIGLFFHIIGVSTPNWSTYSISLVTVKLGLWKYCFSSLGTTVCTSYGGITLTDGDWIKACQAMGILGVLTIIAAIILNVLCVAVLTKQDHKIAFILTPTLAFIGAGCIFIANMVWGAKISDWSFIIASANDLALGWSFALSLVGGLFAVAGGVLFGVGFTKG
ncbi:uncharacterized protein LOC110440455 [Mizuhopecten yessoensis]|uniref:uncharacterized protein LOC110440455 n=1 Tax=Mizuhopecten yessoensis TaxID=6573 RepID=UPI000B45F259|nr:uncharacterized protein LOC110440455 [Mizuhopecten yessoensis]